MATEARVHDHASEDVPHVYAFPDIGRIAVVKPGEKTAQLRMVEGLVLEPTEPSLEGGQKILETAYDGQDHMGG